jgi:diadenylate cyclase
MSVSRRSAARPGEAVRKPGRRPRRLGDHAILGGYDVGRLFGHFRMFGNWRSRYNSNVNDSLDSLTDHLRVVDLLDIAVVAVLLYVCLNWLRRRSSRALLVAILLIALLYVLGRALKMYLLSQVFQVGLSVVILGLILVFQEDIRRAFERLARWRPGNPMTDEETTGATLDTLVEAIGQLVESRTGALIVLEGRQSLDRYVRGGVKVDGQISIPLLLSIFDPNSPGHDGAVLIDGDRLASMGLHLPLSENVEQLGGHGTRHSAALGLAERSDALVVTVSEENGTVSVAEGGRLKTLANPAQLIERLDRFTSSLAPQGAVSGVRNLLTRNLGLKLTSLAAAAGLWLILASGVETVYPTYTVPIELRNIPAGLELTGPKPQAVDVTLSGSERELEFLDPRQLVITVDLANAREGRQEINLTEQNLNNPPGVEPVGFEPGVLRFELHRYVRKELPVKVRRSDPRPGLQISEIDIRPPRINVRVRQDRADALTQLTTQMIGLAGVTGPRELTVPAEVILPRGVELAEGAPATVTVRIRIVEQESP